MISNYGQIRKILIFAILEIFGYRRCGRARSGRLRGDRSRLRCCGDSATSLTEKTLLRSRTEGPTAPLRARRHFFVLQCKTQRGTDQLFLLTMQRATKRADAVLGSDQVPLAPPNRLSCHWIGGFESVTATLTFVA